MKKLIVFTDLDGSLLDHDTYDWQQALPAIKSLKKHAFPMIINSSKTSSEIKHIRDKMHNHAPFICENGAIVHLNEKLFETPLDKMHEVYFSKPYSYIQDVLTEIQKNHHFDMLGFNDIDVKSLMELTDLDEICATAAKQREATEPLIWNDTEASLQTFKTLLSKHNLSLTEGGRFYHVMSPVNKGDSIQYLYNKYQEMEPDTQWVSAGLGDSFNDVPMLENVDFPVLIKNPHSKKLDVSHINNLVKSELVGPAGWNTEVLNIINTITGTE